MREMTNLVHSTILGMKNNNVVKIWDGGPSLFLFKKNKNKSLSSFNFCYMLKSLMHCQKRDTFELMISL